MSVFLLGRESCSCEILLSYMWQRYHSCLTASGAENTFTLGHNATQIASLCHLVIMLFIMLLLEKNKNKQRADWPVKECFPGGPQKTEMSAISPTLLHKFTFCSLPRISSSIQFFNEVWMEETQKLWVSKSVKKRGLGWGQNNWHLQGNFCPCVEQISHRTNFILCWFSLHCNRLQDTTSCMVSQNHSKIPDHQVVHFQCFICSSGYIYFLKWEHLSSVQNLTGDAICKYRYL